MSAASRKRRERQRLATHVITQGRHKGQRVKFIRNHHALILRQKCAVVWLLKWSQYKGEIVIPLDAIRNIDNAS